MAEGFRNIIDYVWESRESFSERPLCRVDSLVFSQIAYFRLPSEALGAWGWQGLPMHELWRSDWLEEMTGRMYDPPGALRLASALAASPRFRDVLIRGYVAQLDHLAEMQFSAMTFTLPSHQSYIAFGGTDNTVVGWKENLNMAFQVRVPSQAQALRYVERSAVHVMGDLWVGGHSKGGNMALYVGMNSEPALRSRLLCCFSHDGPGFTSAMIADLADEGRIVPLDKTVPKSSVFGMLFNQYNQDALIVRSVSSGFAQHDPLSWEVDGNDFVYEEHLGRTASYLDTSLNAWIARTSLEERERFVEAVFAIMKANETRYTHDILVNWRTSVPTMARTLASLDPELRDVLVHKVYELVRELGPGESKEARERADWVELLRVED